MKLWISTILLAVLLYILFQFVPFTSCKSCADNKPIPTMTNIGSDEIDDSDDTNNKDDSDRDDDSDSDDDEDIK